MNPGVCLSDHNGAHFIVALVCAVILAGCAGEMERSSDGLAPGDDLGRDSVAGDSLTDVGHHGESSGGPDALPDATGPDSAGAFTYGPNMIQGGGFEAGPSPKYAGVGKHWETNDAKSHGSNHSLDTTHKHGGTTSQKIDTKGVWDHHPTRQVTGYGSVTPGRTYRLRAWVRSKGNTNPNSYYVIGIWWFYNDAKLGEKLNAKQPTTSYDWRLLTIEAKAPAKANRLAAFLSAHYHGVVWYDDIEVRERKTPP